MARERPPALTVSDAAAARLKHLIAARETPAVGLRIGVRNGGCSGLAYTMEFAADQNPLDEVVETKGVKVLIESKALMFLLGSEMDYTEDKLRSGFTFRNPNEKGRCGCGESFHV
jgi:iron-sulfur cluster assembly protein